MRMVWVYELEGGAYGGTTRCPLRLSSWFCSDARCKSRCRKNNRPNVTTVKCVCIKQLPPGFALPKAERKFKSKRKGEPARADGVEP